MAWWTSEENLWKTRKEKGRTSEWNASNLASHTVAESQEAALQDLIEDQARGYEVILKLMQWLIGRSFLRTIHATILIDLFFNAQTRYSLLLNGHGSSKVSQQF